MEREKNQYWKDLISMAQRALSDKGKSEAVSVIKNGQLDVRFNSYDNWNGGINYWDIVFMLKYKDFTRLNDLSMIEKVLEDAISLFHKKDESNKIARVVIEPIVERMIDWETALPYTKESTIKLIEEEQKMLTGCATCEISFTTDGVEEEYQKRHQQILDLANKVGFDYPVKVESLNEWWIEIKKIPGYLKRRAYIAKIFFPLLKMLRESEDVNAGFDFSQIAARSDTIKKAVEDAEFFIKEGKYDSAVDRVHTAFHGYLQQLLDEHKVTYNKKEDIAALYSKLHDLYGKSIQPSDVASRIKTIVRSGAGMINAVNELRNNNTIVHPNGLLIQKREAQLVIGLTKAMLDYIEEIEQSLATTIYACNKPIRD